MKNGPFSRREKWEDHIRMNLTEASDTNWMEPVQDYSVEYFSINFVN